MNNSIRRGSRIGSLVCATALAVVAMQPLVSLAGDGDGGEGRYGDRMRGEHHRALMVEKLALSDEQVVLMQAVHESRKDNRSILKDAHRQLKQLTHSDNYSEAEAQVLIQQITQLESEDMLARATAQNTFYKSLSDEQKATLAELREERRHGDGRQGNGHRGDGPRRL